MAFLSLVLQLSTGTAVRNDLMDFRSLVVQLKYWNGRSLRLDGFRSPVEQLEYWNSRIRPCGVALCQLRSLGERGKACMLMPWFEELRLPAFKWGGKMLDEVWDQFLGVCLSRRLHGVSNFRS